MSDFDRWVPRPDCQHCEAAAAEIERLNGVMAGPYVWVPERDPFTAECSGMPPTPDDRSDLLAMGGWVADCLDASSHLVWRTVVRRLVDELSEARTNGHAIAPAEPPHDGSCSDLTADATKRTGREG